MLQNGLELAKTLATINHTWLLEGVVFSDKNLRFCCRRKSRKWVIVRVLLVVNHFQKKITFLILLSMKVGHMALSGPGEQEYKTIYAWAILPVA